MPSTAVLLANSRQHSRLSHITTMPKKHHNTSTGIITGIIIKPSIKHTSKFVQINILLYFCTNYKGISYNLSTQHSID